MNSLLFRRSRFCYNFRAIKKAAPSKTVLPLFTIRPQGLHRIVYMPSKQFCPLLKRKTYFYCLPSNKTVLPPDDPPHDFPQYNNQKFLYLSGAISLNFSPT